MSELNCKFVDCDGKVDVNTGKHMRGEKICRPILACNKCGKAHYDLGAPLEINGKPVYFKNGELQEQEA